MGDKQKLSAALLFLLVLMADGELLKAQEDPFMTEQDSLLAEPFQMDDHIIYITDRWKFQPGDSLQWASPDYDDRAWTTVSTYLTELDLAFTEWSGTGWFRLNIEADTSVTGRPLALLINQHLGASEIYINGKKVLELGKFSTEPLNAEPNENKDPRVVIFPEQKNQLIAVRYTDPNYLENLELLGSSGFRFLFGDWEYHREAKISFLENWISRFMFFLGVLVAFGTIHFLLYIYYPAEKRNLYFSIFAFFLAILVFSFYRIELSGTADQTIFLTRLIYSAEVITLIFATRFTHSIYKHQSNKYLNIYLAAGAAVAGIVWFYPVQTLWLREIFILFSVFEILRVIGLLFRQGKRGVNILGAGILFFVAGLLYSIAVNLEWAAGDVSMGSMTGASFLIISMSLFLSREFSVTQKGLENKIVEIRELSEKNLQQEKLSKQRELEKKLLEAENERKSLELEEARALQLSMLPQKLPDVHPYEIAVYMETANEVGGDYYDYSIGKNGELVVTVGDATGHGLKAGIMVAAAKSYFHTMVHESGLLRMLARMSSGIRNLNMKMMYMALMLVKCKKYEVEITAAGMPPALHYHGKSGLVEQILLKGLPLGTKVDYPYKTRKINLQPGDYLLLMSDGLMELFNEERNMLGLEKIEQEFASAAANTAQAGDIIDRFVQLIRNWAGDLKNEDDITIMVMKII
ncbi:MAG: SpoIIE family protein phosphatase [Balneolaceae bacterium]